MCQVTSFSVLGPDVSQCDLTTISRFSLMCHLKLAKVDVEKNDFFIPRHVQLLDSEPSQPSLISFLGGKSVKALEPKTF